MVWTSFLVYGFGASTTAERDTFPKDRPFFSIETVLLSTFVTLYGPSLINACAWFGEHKFEERHASWYMRLRIICIRKSVYVDIPIAWWSATHVRIFTRMVRLYLSTYPFICGWYVVVRLFLMGSIRHTPGKNVDVKQPLLYAVSSSGGP